MGFMDKKIIFITGGVRSGKSQFAMDLAGTLPGPKAYLATAQPLDEEMARRIQNHRRSRPEGWRTFEESLSISKIIADHGNEFSLILLDCVTLWISNALMAGWIESRVLEEAEIFLRICRSAHSSVIVVGNEVGWGIVPDNAMARIFRDLSGSVQQKIAGEADEVYLLVAGIPQKIKPHSA
jgi:adenosylcobinamide kinase/adenosylcobinamide-phosphate guanylyltransferase